MYENTNQNCAATAAAAEDVRERYSIQLIANVDSETAFAPTSLAFACSTMQKKHWTEAPEKNCVQDMSAGGSGGRGTCALSASK